MEPRLCRDCSRRAACPLRAEVVKANGFGRHLIRIETCNKHYSWRHKKEAKNVS